MIWLDDADGAGLHPAARMSFDVGDRGLTLGDGLFTTMTAWNGIVFRRAAHVRRLLAGCDAIRLAVTPERIAAAIDALLPLVPRSGGILRVTVTRGAGGRGLALPAAARPTVLATMAPWSPELTMQPQRLTIAAAARNDLSPLSRLKTLGYLDAVLAMAAAADRGATDALFLNTRGALACSTMANVFVVFADRVVTPPLADGVLPGIMRGLLLDAGRIAGRPVIEQTVARDALADATAMVLTNSVRLAMPVVEIAGAAVDGRSATEATAVLRLLTDAIAAECGVDPHPAGV